MLKIRSSTLAVVFLLFIGCGGPADNEADKQQTEVISQNTDSTTLLSVNLKKGHPNFDLKPDSSLVDTAKYPAVYYPDTTHCNSFWFNRVFLGKLNMAKAKVLEHGSAEKLYLQAGNLNLWVCNLPQKVKAGDTVLITGLVYDILGNEKTWGYPTLLTAIRMSN